MDVSPISFDHFIPLFPLPNCVLFPGVVQPLHIFEPRYREMMEDLLAGPGAEAGRFPTLALALLKPGWEKQYYGSPPIHEILCAGRVVAHERLEDGKFNLLLHGITRARVLREHRQNGYRVALLEPVSDISAPPAPGGHGPADGSGRERLQRKILRDLFEKTALKELTVAPTIATLFEEGITSSGEPGVVPLSRLVDALAFTLVQDVAAKQRLLEQRDHFARGELLLRELVALAARLGSEAPENKWVEPCAWPPPMNVN